jgi:DNA-binding transcriptional LysR family regulator
MSVLTDQISLRDLRYVLSLAEHEHFGRAAAA